MTNLASKLLAISHELIEIASEHAPVDAPVVDGSRIFANTRKQTDIPNLEELVALARREYCWRQARTRHIPTYLLGEPAWDILLELYANQLEPIGLAVTGACIASAAPMATALRWIGMLEEEGWIVRKTDETDRRRFYLTLSTDGRNRMTAILSERLNGNRKTAGLFPC